MYNQRLSMISNFSLENLIIDCRQKIPQEYKRCAYLHPELNHGVDLLLSEEALDCYMVAYGEMHQNKCRAAIQNFPFNMWDVKLSNNESFGGSIEIVDWGCGQGIGALTMIESLKDRGLMQWLKKITLIEPSIFSLNRAKCNVLRAVNNSVEVNDINKYLPGKVENEQSLLGLNYTCRSVIHIFSNILDVDDVDLASLAKIVATSSNNHYVLCIGPMNSNSYRLDRFYEIFGKPKLFSNISSTNYSTTSDTNYIYTCKTKCFLYDGRNLDTTKYNPLEKAKSKVYGEYDINLHISNGILSEDKAWVYYRLQCILLQDDLIYMKPDFNGICPDFVVVRPNYGVVIIDVFENDIKELRSIKEGHSDNMMLNPIDLLKEYQDVVIGSLEGLTNAVVEDNRNLSVVKKMLVCSKNSKEEIQNCFSGNENYTCIYGKEFIADETVSRKMYMELGFRYRNSYFNDKIVKKLIKLISPSWHSFREGKIINLTTIQAELSKSEESRMQKISGTAGAGKTQVMCTRAVNAQVRTGGRVLLLTFNIALIKYLRIRLSEIRADFSWDRMDLDHYHGFFRKNAGLYDLKVGYDSYNEINFFDRVKENIEKYDAIFIDEVQDYATEWLEILKNVFLKPNGEFVVFGDPAQNIYNRDVDTNGDIRIGVIPGVWNKRLTKSKRFSNLALEKLARDFKRNFDKDSFDEIDNNQEGENFNHQPGLLFNYIRYSYLDYNKDQKTVWANVIYNEVENHLKKLQKNKEPHIGDVAVISPQIEILQDLEDIFRENGIKSTTTFVSKENEYRITKGASCATYQYKNDYNRYERLLKLTFTTETDHIKMSTIQSFKGWESKTVILIITKENEQYNHLNITMSKLIYTGITRAKENLIIINAGNKTYDDFFRNNIENG